MDYNKSCKDVLDLDANIRPVVCNESGETRFGDQREGVKNVFSPEEIKKSYGNTRHGNK